MSVSRNTAAPLALAGNPGRSSTSALAVWRGWPGIKPYVPALLGNGVSSSLGPKKSGTGHWLYRRKEVEMALEIKRLL